MKRFIGLDFETFSKTDIRKHGLDRYVSDPSFTPLIASLSEHPSVKGPITYDFVSGEGDRGNFLGTLVLLAQDGYVFVAQNVGFERAVLRHMGMEDEWLYKYTVDSAVAARCHGAGSSLEASAAQLTNITKLETGMELIKLFCVPNELNGYEAPTREFIEAHREQWDNLIEYCEVDSIGCVEVYLTVLRANPLHYREDEYELVTSKMNQTGWKVDLDLVTEMQLRYEANVQQALYEFQLDHDVAGELNFSSPMQLKKWCADRGVKATSFDSDNVDKLLKRVRAKLDSMHGDDPKMQQYSEVEAMLATKQVLGGSSLKKLQTIVDTVGPDGRLRNQYMHVGAGQTYRTSGRGVQMQNLKRLGSQPMEMEDLYDPSFEADNDTLGENLRQVFTASDPQGQLIVGDFSSVESRGLAWLAGEDWKIDAYRQGKDIYKVLASKFTGIPYGQITKEQRAEGKYSELSCGYQAGAGAVQSFMGRLGFEVTLEGAGERVNDWRNANPKIVDMWDQIDKLLHAAMAPGPASLQREYLAHGLVLQFTKISTPASLLAQHPGAQSLEMSLKFSTSGEILLQRVFHGCYSRGRNICYYKPAERKSGPLWSSHFIDPKTKQVRFYDIYGGKLSGILTQSLCREMFFYSLGLLDRGLKNVPNATIVGQFHDEIVVDWVPSTAPGALSQERVQLIMEACMSENSAPLAGFPLSADIKSGYRYIK